MTLTTGVQVMQNMESEKLVPVWRRWTPAEEKQLQDMLDAAKTALEISRKLKRTFQAIYARLQRLYRWRPRV